MIQLLLYYALQHAGRVLQTIDYRLTGCSYKQVAVAEHVMPGQTAR